MAKTGITICTVAPGSADIAAILVGGDLADHKALLRALPTGHQTARILTTTGRLIGKKRVSWSPKDDTARLIQGEKARRASDFARRAEARVALEAPSPQSSPADEAPPEPDDVGNTMGGDDPAAAAEPKKPRARSKKA